MNKELKTSPPKKRIVVLEKGKEIEIDAGAICCWTTFMPIRAY
jgi:hypothetical protein